jgi:hypothetical protein
MPAWKAVRTGRHEYDPFLLRQRHQPRVHWHFAGLPRQRLRGRATLALAFFALVFTAIGCGGATGLDPGTAKGSYIVVVTDTSGSGLTQSQTSVNLPTTIH